MVLDARSSDRIDQIDIYVGNQTSTFASKGHGARVLPFYINQAANLTEDYGGYGHDPSGALQIKLANPNGQFNRTNLPESVRYHGVAKVFLGPAQFQLANNDQALSYIRAFARTITDVQAQENGLCPEVGAAGSKCGDRFAFSNPIWAKYSLSCPRSSGRPGRPAETALNRISTPYLDADNDGIPDVCKRDIPNPCTRQPEADVDIHRPMVEGTRTPAPSSGRPETGPIGQPPVAVEGALDRPTPAKPVPDNSCQVVESPA